MLKTQGQNANPRNIAETIVANIPDNNIISKVDVWKSFVLVNSSPCCHLMIFVNFRQK